MLSLALDLKKSNFYFYHGKNLVMDALGEIARMVRFHRKQSGLTQIELANLAGVGKTVVHDLEHGKRTIRLDTLAKILEALNIEIRFESPLMSLYRETRSAKG